MNKPVSTGSAAIGNDLGIDGEGESHVVQDAHSRFGGGGHDRHFGRLIPGLRVVMPPRLQMALLRLWHAWLAGGFLVAWLTADEDTYAMHQFSGYAVLAALALRLVVAMVAPAASPWRLPRPKLRWSAKGRNPLFAWFAAALLITITLAAGLGALADGLSWLEHPHEALANLALWVIFAHVGFVAFLFGGKRLLARHLPKLGFKEKLS